MLSAAFTRRGFLAAGAGLLLAAACGGNDDDGDAVGDGGSPSGSGSTGELSVARFIPDGILLAGAGPQRMPVGLADVDGLLSDVPAEVTARILFDGGAVGEPMTVARHDAGLPRPYYPVMVAGEEPGLYTLVLEADGARAEAAFSLADPSRVTLPKPGDPMVSVVTPTVADPRGVDPICTREPACPLHDVSLADALGEGKPIAFLVATPAYCQQAVCGPVLDILLSQRDAVGDVVRMIHAEVYTDRTLATTTEAVQAFQLPFEPVLYLAGADGVIRERLDSLYDEIEVRDALQRLVA